MAKRAHYPSISLPDAIERVKAIYNAEGTNNMSSEVAVAHMGYRALSGTAMSVLASLKRYNLMDGRADDLHVSQDAVVIICDEGAEDQSERAEALDRAMRNDSTFSELLDRLGSKTTELNVSSHLKKKGFNPNAADKAASSFIESVQFVNEQTEGYNSEAPQAAERPSMSNVSTQSTPGEMTSFPIYVSDLEVFPRIVIPKKLTGEKWDEMMNFLTTMKPALTTNSTGSSTVSSNESLDTEGKED